MKELRKGDLCGVAQLDELTVNGNNLQRFAFSHTQILFPCRMFYMLRINEAQRGVRDVMYDFNRRIASLEFYITLHSTRLKSQHILTFIYNFSCAYRYESGTLGDIWPLGRVTLNLHGPLMTNDTFVSDLLADVLYPETPIVFQDLHLIGNESIQHLRAVAGRRARSGKKTLKKK